MSTSVEHLVAQADHLIDLDRPDQALRLLGEALAQEPNHAGALCAAARAHLQTRRYDKALHAVELALAAEPDHPFPAYLRASILVAVKRPDALAAAESAVRLAPGWWPAHGVLARALVMLGRRDAALRVAQHVVALAPTESGAHYLLGDVADDVGRSTLAAAEFREALRLDPSDVAARIGLAGVDLRRGRIRSGADHLLGAAPQDPRAAGAAGALVQLVNLGFIFSLFGVGLSAFVALIALVIGGVAQGAALTWARLLCAVMAGALAIAFGWLATRVPRAARPLVRSMLRTNRNRLTPIGAGVVAVGLLAGYAASGQRLALVLLILLAFPAFLMADLMPDPDPDDEDRPRTADDILY